MVLRNREMHARNDDDDAPVPCGATPNLAQLGEMIHPERGVLESYLKQSMKV